MVSNLSFSHIREIMVIEDAKEAVNESDLEQALMDHLPDKKKLEEFMLKELEEMGM